MAKAPATGHGRKSRPGRTAQLIDALKRREGKKEGGSNGGRDSCQGCLSEIDDDYSRREPENPKDDGGLPGLVDLRKGKEGHNFIPAFGE